MVLAELLGDIGKRQVRQLADEVHGDLAGLRRALVFQGAAQGALVDGVEAADLADDEVRRGDGLRFALIHILDGARDVRDVQRHAGQVVIGLDLLDGALDLADVVRDIFGDVIHDVLRQLDAQLQRLFARDDEARLVIGRLDIHDKAPLEAGAQPVLQTDHVAGNAVGRQDDLTLILVERVERMEKFLLRGVLACDELDIVHEEEVGVAVFVTELEVLAAADGVDQLVCELVALDVDDVIVRVLALDLVGDGIEQVRLAEAGLAVDEQGVIGVGGVIRDGAGGGKRVLVRRTDDEFIERILRVELDEIAVFLVLGVLRQLGLVEDDDLDLRAWPRGSDRYIA